MAEPFDDHAWRPRVKEIVQEVLKEGDFVLTASYGHVTPDEWGRMEAAFKDRVEGRQQNLEEHLEEVAEVILGTKLSEFQGGGRDENGMCHRMDQLDKKVEAIDEKLSNGGLKVKIPTTIYVALITMFGGIIVALIQLAATH